MNVLSLTDAAYIAGVMDSDGTIVVACNKTSRSAKGCRRNLAYRAYVAVTLTHKPLLVWLRETVGAGQICPKKCTKVGHKAAWVWTVWSKEAAVLTSTIRPHLKIKGPQADNLIKFQSIMRQPGQNGLTDAEWDMRELHHMTSKTLNQRGTKT